MEPYETISSKKVYEGRILNIVQDEITLPNGKTAMREVIQHSGAAAVLPIDENGMLVLVSQYRHAAKQMVLEIPAGILEKGEKPIACAKRELEEETGYKSEDITFLTEIFTAIGYSDEVIHIYLAKNLEQGTINLDPEEFIEIQKYTLEEAVQMIFDSKITDSKTIISILAYKEMFFFSN